MDASYYRHTSAGVVQFDPGQGTRYFEPHYALLLCDGGILDYFAWLMSRQGMPVQKWSRWGPHVTFVRGEEPAAPELWGQAEGEVVPFRYSHEVHWVNGTHAWVNVWCPRLTEIRSSLGLTAKPARYHLTIGKLVHPRENVKTDHGDPAVL